MADNIDTRVTPSLHPLNVSEIDGYDADTAIYLAPTEAALSTVYEGLRTVHDAREKAEQDSTMNESARLVAIDDFGQRVFTRAAGALDSALGSLKRSIASLEGEMNAPITAKASHMLSSEIRAHAKSLGSGERLALIRGAIESGDETTASALLGAPAYLSGLEAEMQSILTRMYHEKADPKKAKQLRAMQGAADLIMNRGALLHKELTKAIGAEPHKIARLRAAKNEAEKARILKDA